MIVSRRFCRRIRERGDRRVHPMSTSVETALASSIPLEPCIRSIIPRPHGSRPHAFGPARRSGEGDKPWLISAVLGAIRHSEPRGRSSRVDMPDARRPVPRHGSRLRRRFQLRRRALRPHRAADDATAMREPRPSLALRPKHALRHGKRIANRKRLRRCTSRRDRRGSIRIPRNPSPVGAVAMNVGASCRGHADP